MSKLLYIAGNYPIKEVKDPHIKTMSINEALDAGVQVLDMLLQDENLDRDEPDVILWMDDDAAQDDGFLDDHFSISPFEKWEDILTEKTYCASLNWNYSKGRAARVAAFIKEYLQHTEEVEIWNIFMGASYPPPQIKKINISASELTNELLKKIDQIDDYSQETYLYKGYLPDEWNISDEDLNQDIQYCFVISKT